MVDNPLYAIVYNLKEINHRSGEGNRPFTLPTLT